MVKVLVIGDAILDRYIYGTINRQSPEDSSIPVVDINKEEYRLGGSMNVAANIRSISYPNYNKKEYTIFTVSLSSVFSSFTGNKLFQKGILCDDSCVIDEIQQGTLMPSNSELIKTRVIDQKTGKQLIRIDNRKQYSSNSIKMYKDCFGSINDSYDAVVVSDYNKGLVNGFTLEKLKNYHKPVFVDSKNPDLSFWTSVPNVIIKMNEKEYSESFGGENLQQLIITKGEKGCTLRDGTNFIDFPTKSIENADVIGSGDVFLAGLVVHYMRHKNLHFAIGFANMCAGLSVKQNGTTEVRLW